MLCRRFINCLIFVFALVAGCLLPRDVPAAACVWKVTGVKGGTLYLGGSWHALRTIDYPLPPAYSRALDSSSRLALEVDPKAMRAADKSLTRASEYPKGDNLKKHVDPRTYAYLRKIFSLLGVSEDKFSRFHPWFLALMLESPGQHGLKEELGVEEFLTKRAKSKPISGLETAQEHVQVFTGLSDRESEALLLLAFIPAASDSPDIGQMMKAWKRGDADMLTRVTLANFRDFPSLGQRILTARNRDWVPKIEGYLSSGQTYFVVAGAAHMGGNEGLVTMLRARGLKVEQL